jgi:hypothetical protein
MERKTDRERDTEIERKRVGERYTEVDKKQAEKEIQGWKEGDR